jgi:hypothetical protein
MIAHHRQAFAQLLLGAAAIHRQLPHPRPDLLLEAADALHEKLVEIGTDNRHELDPLQQRGAFVLRLVQHPPVERQPGQFAVQIPFRGVEIDRRRRGIVRHRRGGFRHQPLLRLGPTCCVASMERVRHSAPPVRRIRS